MNATAFKPHGKLNIELHGNIVILDIEGPLNLEFFKDMAHQLKAIEPRIDINNCGSLIIFRGEAITFEDALDYFVEYLKKVQVKAVALNLSYSATPILSKKQCSTAYSRANICHSFFDNNQEALAWIEQQLN